MEDKELLSTIAQIIYDKKGSNILALDLSQVENGPDYLLIGEGNIDRHVVAIASTIQSTLKDEGIKPIRTEGMQSGDWVVLDYGSIAVHLFMPEMRERYRLEALWNECKPVELGIEVVESL
ncbi:MAG: ribosome silencing factor [Simkaniaceae bacterium]|nr:ribosome silencing factor [Simkaniaceae bacterium]